MAQYRLEAQLIKRSAGRSATAAAAYRASAHLVDERTGERHDYSRKGGTLHSEIMTPDNTPEWMRDRNQLWNAVEKVERRKDAQLAREVLLSLPHELNHEQRVELVRDFAQNEFINRGMVADIAIHAPHEKGDDRNHHAHIMLTMRELVPDGFGNKNRGWNDREIITNWREQWAVHQNRMLERHGHPERVDHRSYAEQGIDREPTQHRGVAANEMEKRGVQTRVGEKNRAIENRNAQQAKRMAYEVLLSAQISHERGKLKRVSVRQRSGLEQRQKRERLELQQQVRRENRMTRATINSQLRAVSSRLGNATGLRKKVRDLLGITRHDTTTKQQLLKALQAVKVAENIRRKSITRRHEKELREIQKRDQEKSQSLELNTGAVKNDPNIQPDMKDKLRQAFRQYSTRANENERQQDRENTPEGGRERKPE